MKISLITPAHKQSRSGNRTTAVRWARIFRRLGHRVSIARVYQGEPADMMVALHAWRSAEAIRRYRELFPARPLVVALTGTDIYKFIRSHAETTLGSIELADELIGLHDLVGETIPARFHGKLSVIYQSVPPVPRRLAPSRRHFDVYVVGHLREEKDPFRAAYAVRDLPAQSRLRVTHLGKEHEPVWAEEARAEMAGNPRYRWRGEVPGWQVRRAFMKARLMVLSSRMEGGANVLGEALVAGLPVIASDIPGSVGLLGADYPGYYPVADTAALRRLLLRAEDEPDYLDELARRCALRAPLFDPPREEAAWVGVLDRLTSRG